MQDLKTTDLKSYRTTVRRRIQVTHPNIYTFLTHMQNATVDCMTDAERLRRGVEIWRPNKKTNIQNDARISHVSNATTTAPTPVFSFCGQSASLGAHTETFHAGDADRDDEDDTSDQPAVVDPPAAATAAATVNAAV